MQMIPNTGYPRSPFVAAREAADDGFSQGWGFYFAPSEAYWVDAHIHLRGCKTLADATKAMHDFFYQLEAYRLGRIVAFIEDEALFGICSALSQADPRFAWFYWPEPTEDLAVVQRAFARGAVGMKLHNHKAMQGEFDPAVWESPRWNDIFAFLNEKKAAVNWHVTQRVAGSPYHGGGENAYWEEGIPKGVTFTNCDLLAQCLRIADANPNLSMIGAHQLYLSNAKLAELFAAHKNLYVDTSIGYFLRWADTLQPEDLHLVRDFVIAHADRMIFGSDTIVTPENVTPYLIESWKCHARFVASLKLPNDTLQAVTHGNIERILRLPPCDETRKFCSRP